MNTLKNQLLNETIFLYQVHKAVYTSHFLSEVVHDYLASQFDHDQGILLHQHAQCLQDGA